jgi:hypothetical protein
MTETLHHALGAIMQFTVIFFFFRWILPSTNKKLNSFLKFFVRVNVKFLKEYIIVTNSFFL